MTDRTQFGKRRAPKLRKTEIGDEMTSIVKQWAADLGLRHQGVLMAAVRGCDGAEKEDPCKWLNRFYRACVLHAHVGDPAKAVSFMVWTDQHEEFVQRAELFMQSLDHYPMHYLTHMMFAAEVCGYKMPPSTQQKMWAWFYKRLVHKLHLNPETEEQLDARLNADEQNFGRQQKE